LKNLQRPYPILSDVTVGGKQRVAGLAPIALAFFGRRDMDGVLGSALASPSYLAYSGTPPGEQAVGHFFALLRGCRGK
jgi:hypothetical protein